MQIRGPGIFYVDGAVRAPLAGVGDRGAFASNRLALDDANSEATIDEDARRIVIVNRHRYDKQTLIGDFVALGRGRTSRGDATFAVHTRFDMKGTTLRARPHLHPSASGALHDLEIDPYEVILSNGARDSHVLTSDLARNAVIRAPTSDWLGRALLTVSKNTRATNEATRVADLIISVGVGPLRRDMVRVEAHSIADTQRTSRKLDSLTALLTEGAWELRLTGLANMRSLREHLWRAFFLLGLEKIPTLARIEALGLPRHETLVFRLQNGRGEVSLAGKRAEVPGVLDIARAYLEFDFVGAILARELSRVLRGEAASTRAASDSDNARDAIVL